MQNLYKYLHIIDMQNPLKIHFKFKVVINFEKLFSLICKLYNALMEVILKNLHSFIPIHFLRKFIYIYIKNGQNSYSRLLKQGYNVLYIIWNRIKQKKKKNSTLL